MKENDKIKNNPGPPDQNTSADPVHRPYDALSPNSVDRCRPATDHGPLTTDARPNSSTNPSIHSSARRRRAPYRHRNHRRTGKVARLPSMIKNEICLRFMRYEEYKDIIAWLASQGHSGISESNLSRWRKGGFQDWLRKEQEKRLDLIDVALAVLEELVESEQSKLTHSDSCQSSNHPSIHSSKNPSSSSLPNLLGGGPESTLNT